MAETGVTIVDGVIRIDHPEIEAGLGALARRWDVPVEQALMTALQRAVDFTIRGQDVSG